MKEEIPPYQAIDLLTGSKHNNEPQCGWAICCPTNGAVLVKEIDDGKLQEIKNKSKYPNSVSVFKAWIHNYKTNKEYWTLR